MAQLRTGYVKASTLLEVIVSMVIILIVFVIGVGIYTNVLRSSPTVKQQQGRALAAGMILQSKTEQDWSDKQLQVDSIHLKQVVIPYQNYTDLSLVTVTATERGKVIGKVMQLVRRMENEDQ